MRPPSRVLIVSTAILIAQPVVACPICLGADETPTLAERYHLADVIAIARCVPASADDPLRISNRYEVISVERDMAKEVRPGTLLTLWPKSQPGSLVWLMGVRGVNEKSPGVSWDDPTALTPALAGYIRNAPPPYVVDRLKYFARFLEHPDPEIAADAWREFALADMDDVVSAARTIRPAKLRAAISRPNRADDRRNLYGLLLGFCGGQAEAADIERCILNANATGESQLFDGLISGYLLIRGADGLAKLEEAVLRDKQSPFGVRFGALRAFDFLRTHAPGTISADRLRESTLLLLDHSELADLVVAHFARTKDWTLIDRIVSMHNQPDFDVPSIRRAIVRYLITCKKEADKDCAAAARQHLAAIRERDPKTVRDVERFFR